MNYADAREAARLSGCSLYLTADGSFAVNPTVDSIVLETFDAFGNQRWLISIKGLSTLTRFATPEQIRIIQWLILQRLQNISAIS